MCIGFTNIFFNLGPRVRIASREFLRQRKLRIWYPGAHRLGYQVRPLDRYLRHGLLCRPWQGWHEHCHPAKEDRQSWIFTQVGQGRGDEMVPDKIRRNHPEQQEVNGHLRFILTPLPPSFDVYF